MDFGNKPSPRYGHTMIYYKGTIILYGGMGNDNKLDDDKFYQYKVDYKMWQVLNVTGVRPVARFQHSMNFYKKDELIVFGGKIAKDHDTNYVVANDLYNINLLENNSLSTFVADVGPSARFGHASAFNSSFLPDEHLIVGGLDKIYCSFDVYAIREISINNENRWNYEQKKLHSTTGVNPDEQDPIFETAKRAIINHKKQIEVLESKNLEVNKK